MILLPPTSTRTDTLVPHTTLVRARDARRSLRATQRALYLLPDELVEEVLHLGTVRAHHRELTGEEGALLVDGGQREPVVVRTCFGILVEVAEEGVDEAGLAVQVAPGRVLEERTGSVTEGEVRSEEHTSELQSLMRISYAVFCLK